MNRTRINLNRDWKFFRGDIPGAEAPNFHDASWQPIGLPHTFDLPYFRTPEFYVGYGWYRKRLQIAPRPQPTRCFLEFDGVFQEAEVFVNGMAVGSHQGGYTAFSIDATDAIVSGENILAMRVNNNWNARLQPRAGEHIFSGGIYRDVHLNVVNPLHIAWNGITITTPNASNTAATVHARVRVRNDDNSPRICVLKSQIYDPNGQIVAEISTVRAMAPGELFEFDQISSSINSPRLWHPDHPDLYRLRAELSAGGEVSDEIETCFGIRSIEWTSDRGFSLNGEHLYLRGANIHQDHAGWGIGITRAACERDVRLMKEAGFNFIRGAHYPHHPAFADACDHLGMLLWSENPFWGKGGFGPEGFWNASSYPVEPADFQPFEQSCRDQLREMIEQNRNHPSIIAWSMCNEPFFTYNLDRARALLTDLVKLSRELDPTRPAAIGGAQRGEIDRIGDVAGYNGDGARLFIDPGIPNLVSEYGAITKPRDACEPFLGEKQSEEFAWRSGEAIWCGFDYGSIAGRQGLKGICDHFRLPKRSWDWYRAHLRNISPPPAPGPGLAAKLWLEVDKTCIPGTDATDDVQLVVTVCDAAGKPISNSPPVTLTIVSGPGEFPTGRSITFSPDSDIRIAGGRAAIAFRSYHGGESVIRATSPGLADATITIETIGEPRFIPGQTPPCLDQPYIPPAESQAAKRAMRNSVNVALNRPSRASSERENHPARFANDGDAATSWLAAADDPEPWWQVDLEGFYQLSTLRLSFPSEGNRRFIIELSRDAIDWQIAIDRRQSTRVSDVRDDIFPPGAVARFVRCRFSGASPAAIAAISEFELFGVLSLR